VVKTLTRSGSSLADIYDVVGSSVAVEQLRTEELPIVHEMGSTVFSERMSFAYRRAPLTGIAQNTDFDIVTTDLPNTPTRLLGVGVFTDDASRILRAAVIASIPLGRELPLWVFDGTNFIIVRMRDSGTVGNEEMLLPSPATELTPNFVGGSAQPQTVADINLRGRTTGFGAGTVDIFGLYYLAFSQVGPGLSSRGLPVPGW